MGQNLFNFDPRKRMKCVLYAPDTIKKSPKDLIRDVLPSAEFLIVRINILSAVTISMQIFGCSRTWKYFRVLGGIKKFVNSFRRLYYRFMLSTTLGMNFFGWLNPQIVESARNHRPSISGSYFDSYDTNVGKLTMRLVNFMVPESKCSTKGVVRKFSWGTLLLCIKKMHGGRNSEIVRGSKRHTLLAWVRRPARDLVPEAIWHCVKIYDWDASFRH